MSRLLNPGLVLASGPVPVTIDAGGFVPVLAFAGLFVEIAMRTGLPVATAAAFGAVGGTASLVLHELGHALAARKLRDVTPIRISLVWLGAATRLDGAYTRGRDQAAVALAGPLASFGFALALAPFALLAVSREVKYLVGALAVFNVALGVINLIPAKPLDGYNAVVGLLWSGIGSEGAARRLLRRAALAWLPVELVGSAVLLVQRPFVGALVFVTIAGLLGQRIYVRHASA